MLKISFLVLTGWLLLAPLAGADRIWLTNGNYLDGESRDLGNGEIEIRSSIGALTVPKSRVARIESFQSYEEIVAETLSRLAPDDVTGRYELAQWLREEGAETLARRLLEQVIALDPDHAEARRALGYQLYDGRWLTPEELHALRGEVLFRGEWMTPEERAQVLALEALRSRSAAQDRAAVQAQARLEAEVLFLQQQVANLGYGQPYYPFGSPVLVPTPVLIPVAHPRVKPPSPAIPQLRRPTPQRVAPRRLPRATGGSNVSRLRPASSPRPVTRLPRVP